MTSCLLSCAMFKALHKWGLLLKERICSKGSKFFPVIADPPEKGGKNKNGRVASSGCVPIHLNPIALRMAKILNPIALRMAKTPQSFGHSECNRVKPDTMATS